MRWQRLYATAAVVVVATRSIVARPVKFQKSVTYGEQLHPDRSYSLISHLELVDA
jgi:hypothetical protein